MSSGLFASPSDSKNLLGSRIRDLRTERKWLQRDLADAARLPVRTIGRIERGEVDVRISTLTRIARALRVSMRELLS